MGVKSEINAAWVVNTSHLLLTILFHAGAHLPWLLLCAGAIPVHPVWSSSQYSLSVSGMKQQHLFTLTHLVHEKSSFTVIFLHNTVVSRVRGLSITHDFGLHGDINSISLYRRCYIYPLKCEWALAQDTTVLLDEMLQS